MATEPNENVVLALVLPTWAPSLAVRPLPTTKVGFAVKPSIIGWACSVSILPRVLVAGTVVWAVSTVAATVSFTAGVALIIVGMVSFSTANVSFMGLVTTGRTAVSFCSSTVSFALILKV